MTFKNGDRVRVTNPLPERIEFSNRVGIVYQADTGPRGEKYRVRFGEEDDNHVFHALEMSSARKRKAKGVTR